MNTVISIRTQKSVRDEARKVFSKIGLSTSAGINLFLHQVAVEKGLPFTPTYDTAKIRQRWDNQVNRAVRHKKYSTAKEALADL
ncbi:MAG: type II toxin-antitoxin system RelB/DinJ family antitoxin [bacterium]